MDEERKEPTTVIDWRAGGFGRHGVVIIERCSDGHYRVGAVIGESDVIRFLSQHLPVEM
jgi:hypothetical protein